MLGASELHSPKNCSCQVKVQIQVNMRTLRTYLQERQAQPADSSQVLHNELFGLAKRGPLTLWAIGLAKRGPPRATPTQCLRGFPRTLEDQRLRDSSKWSLAKQKHDIVTPILVNVLNGVKIDCVLTWTHTNQIFTWNLQTNNVEADKHLCTTLTDLSVCLRLQTDRCATFT